MRTTSLNWLATIVAATAFVSAAHGYQITGRWSATATNGSTGPRGTPVTVTWSIVADGTPVVQGGNSNGSNLIAFLDGIFKYQPPAGSTGDYRDRPWFFLFQDSFDRLSELAGVTYQYEPNDDGVSTGAAGRLGVRGDVRITGKSLGAGSTSLAVNFFPNHSDMVLNTDKTSFFSGTANNYRGVRNVVMHEALHGLGITHVDSSDGDFLMAPYIQTHFEGPQIDEILAMHRNYGDRYEKGGNDSSAAATALPDLSVGGTYQLGQYGSNKIVAADQIDFVSIDGSSDVDFYRFHLLDDARLSLSLTPRGPSYMQSPQDGVQTLFQASRQNDLSLTLFAADGTTVLDLANAASLGGNEYVGRIAAAGEYVVRIAGDRDQTQLYGLQWAAAPPTNELVWMGGQGSEWDVNATPNFAAEGVATPFFSGDRVRFVDNLATKTVAVNANVAPESISVETTERYLFQGPGAIVAGSLTIDGPGEVELATSGNTYAGPTLVNGGTLLINGDANAMTSPIRIASGATVTMDASDAAEMQSTFQIDVGGTLQIGRATSSGNVFPDAPTGVVNHGTIRIVDDEVIANVAGTGVIIVEQETATFAGGNSFTGPVIVKSGATISGSTTLLADVAVETGGTISPGAGVGTLAVGGLTLAAGATASFELGGDATGAFDQISVANEATIAGLLQVSLVDGFMPQVGQRFDLLSASQLVGEFSALSLPSLAADLAWNVAYSASAVELSVASLFAASDFNEDGAVDGDDLAVWKQNFGMVGGASRIDGDANGDFNVDGSDFLAWQREFRAAPLPGAAQIPEPAGGTMLLTIAAFSTACRRSRSSRVSQWPLRSWHVA